MEFFPRRANSLCRFIILIKPARPEANRVDSGFREVFDGIYRRDQCELFCFGKETAEPLGLGEAADAHDGS